ncbi:hypothetical protein WT49_03145 [Burkholderia territorii]|nr:hypothetical protein WT50_21510 [Burkholderia territorii]KWE38264.1 hypothetical protein WT51_30780 [Burkholderia territorii]KWE42908.1 hypothetical protein WT49_03145 [Burkholderia territorii]
MSNLMEFRNVVTTADRFLHHAFAMQATRMWWKRIVAEFTPPRTYCNRAEGRRGARAINLVRAAPELAGAGVGTAGTPRRPIRLMVGILNLKWYVVVCERWAENDDRVSDRQPLEVAAPTVTRTRNTANGSAACRSDNTLSPARLPLATERKLSNTTEMHRDTRKLWLKHA